MTSPRNVARACQENSSWGATPDTHLQPVASLRIAVGLLFGAYVGARFAQHLSPVLLKRTFSIFLVLIAARMSSSP